MSARAERATGNAFLDMMPAAAKAALLPLLRDESFSQHETIYALDGLVEIVHFPIDSIMSIVTDFADGETAESGIIGREGTSGHVIALGQTRSSQRVFVQVAGSSKSIDVSSFRTILERDPELRAYTLRYTQAAIVTLCQSAACNVLHPATERCARWLLMAHDRVADDLILLTQEFLGQMLGLRRGSVALAASALQEAGVIAYSRGNITVRNRSGLEDVSCECYAVVEASFKRIMGYSVSRSATLELRPGWSRVARASGQTSSGR